MTIFGLVPSVTLVMLPIMIIILFAFTLGISFALSPLFVYYRDLRSIWGVVLQVGFFAATIIYQISIFPQNIRPLISLNPLVPLLDISRDVTLYNKWPSTNDLSYLIVITLTTLCVSYLIFKVLDKRIVEEL